MNYSLKPREYISRRDINSVSRGWRSLIEDTFRWIQDVESCSRCWIHLKDAHN